MIFCQEDDETRSEMFSSKGCREGKLGLRQQQKQGTYPLPPVHDYHHYSPHPLQTMSPLL